MTDEPELLPCPFCGGEAEIVRLGDRRRSTQYNCTMCGCFLETGEEWGHGTAWNRRADLPAQDSALALGWMAAREAAAGVAEDRNDVIWDRDTGDLIAKDPTAEAIRALPAPTSAQLLAEARLLPEIAALVEAVERLNATCDAMWNDHKRLEENPSRFGQEWQIKAFHVNAISEAQQALPDILAAIKDASHD